MNRIHVALYAALTLLPALPGGAAGVAWHPDFTAAAAAAQESGRPVLVLFHSVGCGPCVEMEHGTLADEQVVALVARSFEAVSINALTEPEFATRQMVASFPTVKFMAPDGTTVYTCRGYLPAAEFVPVMSEALAGHAALKRAREAAAQPEVTADGARAIAADFLQAMQYAEAAVWARTALAGDLDAASAAEAQFVLGVALVEAGEPAQAVQPLQDALAATGDADWAWQARLKLGYAWLQTGNDDSGIDLLSTVYAAEDVAPKLKAQAARLLRWWGVEVD